MYYFEEEFLIYHFTPSVTLGGGGGGGRPRRGDRRPRRGGGGGGCDVMGHGWGVSVICKLVRDDAIFFSIEIPPMDINIERNICKHIISSIDFL